MAGQNDHNIHDRPDQTHIQPTNDTMLRSHSSDFAGILDFKRSSVFFVLRKLSKSGLDYALSDTMILEMKIWCGVAERALRSYSFALLGYLLRYCKTA